MSLTVDDKVLHNPKKKAEILNNQFYSVFTKENLSNIPKCTGHPYPTMPLFQFLLLAFKNYSKKLTLRKHLDLITFLFGS